MMSVALGSRETILMVHGSLRLLGYPSGTDFDQSPLSAMVVAGTHSGSARPYLRWARSLLSGGIQRVGESIPRSEALSKKGPVGTALPVIG